MVSLTYLLQIFLAIYFGSFLYISYQIIFYFQSKFILTKLILFFSFFAYLIIKLKTKYHIPLLFQLSFFFIIGIFLGRKTFKKTLLKNNKIIKNIYDKNFYKLIYLFKIAIIPPVSFSLFCLIKRYFYHLKYPHRKNKSEYELF